MNKPFFFFFLRTDHFGEGGRALPSAVHSEHFFIGLPGDRYRPLNRKYIFYRRPLILGRNLFNEAEFPVLSESAAAAPADAAGLNGDSRWKESPLLRTFDRPLLGPDPIRSGRDNPREPNFVADGY